MSYVADVIIKYVGKGKKIFLLAEIAQPQQVNVDTVEIKKLSFAPRVEIEEGIKNC